MNIFVRFELQMIKKEMRFFWVWNRVRIWRNGRHTKNQEYLQGNKPRWLPQNLPNCWQGELNFVLKPRSRAAVLPMSLLYKCRKENEILYVWTCGEHLRAEWRIKILTLNLVYHYLLWRWRFFYMSVWAIRQCPREAQKFESLTWSFLLFEWGLQY